MKEVFEKIRERLVEQRGHICNCMPCNGCKYIGDCNEGEFAEDVAIDKAIENVNQVAEEYSNSEIPNMSEKLTHSDGVCEWRLCDEEANVYDTSCRNPHILLEGSPIDNNYSFCPYCGGKIKVV